MKYKKKKILRRQEAKEKRDLVARSLVDKISLRSFFLFSSVFRKKKNQSFDQLLLLYSWIILFLKINLLKNLFEDPFQVGQNSNVPRIHSKFINRSLFFWKTFTMKRNRDIIMIVELTGKIRTLLLRKNDLYEQFFLSFFLSFFISFFFSSFIHSIHSFIHSRGILFTNVTTLRIDPFASLT